MTSEDGLEGNDSSSESQEMEKSDELNDHINGAARQKVSSNNVSSTSPYFRFQIEPKLKYNL